MANANCTADGCTYVVNADTQEDADMQLKTHADATHGGAGIGGDMGDDHAGHDHGSENSAM